MSDVMSVEWSSSRRLALKDHVAIEDVNNFAGSRNWAVAGVVNRDPEEGIFFEKKWRIGEGFAFHYIVDDFMGERYVVVVGQSEFESESYLDVIVSGLDCWSAGEAVLKFDSSVYVADRVRAVRLLGVVSPLAVDSSIADRVVGAAQSESPDVRRAAIWAMGYSDWPEYRERLASLVEAESNGIIRDEAAAILSRLREAR
ncbi:HEAT repeat domain-containing protein [Streptomyces sp. NPDC050433]|uniref:HEAT repeat domain-containing protein n=1 Tax=Streptomyces sp. NPDC050433 TaxID=3365615 RepID=UPI0037995ABE